MDCCLECRNLTKGFGVTTALDGVNLSIAPGRVVGLLGPNGSGKTTLIKLINGLLTPTAGDISICGFQPGKESKALVSYLPDRPCLPEWNMIRTTGCGTFTSLIMISRTTALSIISTLCRRTRDS